MLRGHRRRAVEMSVLCLDTSAYSHFKCGQREAVAALRSARRVYVPVIVIGELLTGFYSGKRAETNDAELSEFLDDPTVEVVDVDARAARIYAELMSGLRKAGKPVPSNDIWI